MIYVSKADITKLKELLTLFNIPYINATGESDGMCSFLYKNKIIDACLSDDMDILVSGCNDMIKFNKGEIIHYQLDHILQVLDLEYEKFVELCVLFGCDYVKPIPKLDNNKIYNLVKQDMSLKEIIDFINTTHIKPKVDSIILENSSISEDEIKGYYRQYSIYKKAKNIFMYAHINENINDLNIIYDRVIINKKNINEFFSKHIKSTSPIINNFILRINNYIDNINEKYKKNNYNI